MDTKRGHKVLHLRPLLTLEFNNMYRLVNWNPSLKSAIINRVQQVWLAPRTS